MLAGVVFKAGNFGVPGDLAGGLVFKACRLRK
jgi:hypothetical protein